MKIRTDNSLTKQISESYQNAYGLADFIITRHTSVFSYLIFLYNKNDVRQHHKLPKYILTFLYKTIDKDILNKPLKEVNQYDVRKVNHDIRLLTQAHSYNILSKEKMIELLKIAPKYENGNAFVICMLGALRMGECWGLSITDVDINNCSIFIHQQLQKS